MKRYLLCIVLVLVACSGTQTNGYFTGTDGVDASYAGQSPPDSVYIRGGQPANFTIDVRIQNSGASVTKGGVYLSGYDPTIMDVQEIDESRDTFKSCRLTPLQMGYGEYEANLQCESIDLGPLGTARPNVDVGFDLSDLNTDSFGDFFKSVFGALDISGHLGFEEKAINFETEGQGSFHISFDSNFFRPEDAARGPYFLSLWAPWSFELNQGQEYTLEGDLPETPGKHEEYITFHAQADLPKERLSMTQPIQATNCYLYTTHASTSVCVDPNPGKGDEKSCRPSTYTNKGGQGSPLAITKVEQIPASDSIVFIIHIANKGGGQVYNPLMIQRCSPHHPKPATGEAVDTAVVGMAYVGKQSLDCVTNKNTVDLQNGKGTVKCVLPLKDQFVSRTGYSAPLMLELWYGYSETIREDITIQRI